MPRTARSGLFLIGALLLVTSTVARAADGNPQLALEQYKLPNGLEVILAPDRPSRSSRSTSGTTSAAATRCRARAASRTCSST